MDYSTGLHGMYISVSSWLVDNTSIFVVKIVPT